MQPDKFVPPDDDALLTRAELAIALTRSGYPISKRTLASLPCRKTGVGGTGPAFRLWTDNKARYRWADALAWARSRVAPVRGGCLPRTVPGRTSDTQTAA